MLGFLQQRELPVLDIEALVGRLLSEPTALDALPSPLPDELAEALVERLKAEADRHWYINANHSLVFANAIVGIGEARRDQHQTALGLMARGDALKYLGNLREAWDTLEEAGRMFQAAGDEVGWARTRIGRLVLCVDLDAVDEATRDAERARIIFHRHRANDKLLRLCINIGAVCNSIGDQQKALEIYTNALDIAQLLGDDGQIFLGIIYTNIGNAYACRGELKQALYYHEQARAWCEQRNALSGVALADVNIAHIAMAQGDYRRALQLLHRSYELYSSEQLHLDATHALADMAACYVLLNRYTAAQEIASEVAQAYECHAATHQRARVLINLATAEAELERFHEATAALEAAETAFTTLKAEAWLAAVQVLRSQIAFRQGEYRLAYEQAVSAAGGFARDNQTLNRAGALLLQGQALLAQGCAEQALHLGMDVFALARSCNIPALRYRTHLLLGQITTTLGQRQRAARHYAAAVATVNRVQRGLTLTLRPGFMQDKTEAFHLLIRHHLENKHIPASFNLLEQTKSQALLEYLANRHQFRWAVTDTYSESLLRELNQLRAEYHWFFQQLNEAGTEHGLLGSGINQEQARRELAERERRLRSLTEQLYLNGSSAGTQAITAPTLHQVQAWLEQGTLLLEFYSDGQRIWCFVVCNGNATVEMLPLTVAECQQLLNQLQSNIAFALKAGVSAPTVRGLTTIAQRLLQRLYAGLMAPLTK
ncbi:MAG: tetratricopeptide repeat protein, partial [Chloroflexaceae bacterium]|nr:tetratricopeptide repeat protein [Chloroflexaceae bacterium]